MKRSIALSIFALALLQVQAQYSQYFTPPIQEEQISMGRNFYVVTNANDTIYGNRLPMATMIDGQVRSFTLKKEDKTKIKFKAEEVKLLAVKLTDFMKVSSALAVPNLLRAIEMDWERVGNREWAFFEQALLPTKKKDKYALMQLLNPGFDSKIKVYLRPNSNETATTEINGIQVGGGEDTSYLIVYDGNKSEVYKKGRYKKEALTRLFKNCDVFVENYSGEKMKWQDISEHVLIYDRLCGDSGTK